MNFIDIIKEAGDKNFRRPTWLDNTFCFTFNNEIFKNNEGEPGEQRFSDVSDILAEDWELMEEFKIDGLLLKPDELIKEYPLDLLNVGTDTYELMSKGHQDPEAFMKAVEAFYPTWFPVMGKPRHVWVKRVFGRFCIYKTHQTHTYPATWCSEGDGND